MTRMKLVTCDH